MNRLKVLKGFSVRPVQEFEQYGEQAHPTGMGSIVHSHFLNQDYTE